MKTLFTTSLGRFKIAAFLEGITFLILVGIAMPLKYVWHKPEWVQNMGMFHGISFVMYLLLSKKISVKTATF
jgi:integral membrane protein